MRRNQFTNDAGKAGQYRHSRLAWCVCVIVIMSAYVVAQIPESSAAVSGEDSSQTRISLDVKDANIRDVIRMISKGYGINIILDRGVSGKVTLHLDSVPVMEALDRLSEAHELKLIKKGDVYRIRDAGEVGSIDIDYTRNRLSANVRNADVMDFIDRVGEKTGISIVANNRIEGRISGKLYSVPLQDGVRALLEANGFKVIEKKEILRVEAKQETERRSGSSIRRSSRSRGGNMYVEYDEGRLSLDVVNADLADVIEEIAEYSDVEIVMYGRISSEVNAKLNDIPITKAMALLLGGTPFTFIQKGDIFLVGERNPSTPSGQALSTSELIHLKHTKADVVAKSIPKNIPANNVQVVKEQNALLISGTSEDIVATREFLDKIDIPTPQVIIDVIVVEYSRDMTRDFGFSFGSNSNDSTRANYYTYPHVDAKKSGANLKGALRSVFPKTKIIDELPETFYARLRLLEGKGQAKVLAQPSITVLNGNEASIDVKQTQYYEIQTYRGDNAEFIDPEIKQISFGINLSITPWISRSGQITADLKPNISNNMGLNDDGLPEVFTRSVSTTVRLENDQTLVLGGLLRSDDQEEIDQVPILGDIPILGWLFKTTKRNKTQTNLVMYITPHIIEKGAYVDLEEELEDFYYEKDRGLRGPIRQEFYGDTLDVDTPAPDTSTHRGGMFKWFTGGGSRDKNETPVASEAADTTVKKLPPAGPDLPDSLENEKSKGGFFINEPSKPARDTRDSAVSDASVESKRTE